MLVAVELTVFLLDVDLMSLIPLYFFAATLHFITLELMLEWLWEVRRRMTSKEYMVLWITFLGNTFLGIIQGFVLGIVCSMFMFVIRYAPPAHTPSQPPFHFPHAPLPFPLPATPRQPRGPPSPPCSAPASCVTAASAACSTSAAAS